MRVDLRDGLAMLPIVELIDRVEQALGTPVQTAVKREDEQAFAALNARNLMFCEDAARRVAHALAADPACAPLRGARRALRKSPCARRGRVGCGRGRRELIAPASARRGVEHQ